MDPFEPKYIYPLIDGKSPTYFRYIGDIFLIRRRTKNELDQFFNDLNKKASIKFDYKTCTDHTVFLDTNMYLQNGKLHTKLYRKKTDRQHYLHNKYEHSKSLKYSLHYSQVIRIKRINSNQVDLTNSLKEIKNNFIKLEYHPSIINEHLERINLLNRIDLITKKDTREKSDKIPLVITYNQFPRNITKTIRKNWNIFSK